MLSLIAAACLAVFAASQPAPLRIEGLVAATFTPFDSNGDFNPAAVDGYASWLNSTGVNWVFVCGTTGESVKLTIEERKAVAEKWIEVAPKYNIQVIVHVGHESTREAIALAQHAEMIGARAIGAMATSFFKPANVEALAKTMSEIYKAAPSLPAYFYHIPSSTGVKFPMLDFVKAMDDLNEAPNFVGIKYTGLYDNPSFMDVQKVLNYRDGKYEILGGRDEMMVETLVMGVVGFVGSQYNFAGDLYNSIRTTFASDYVAARDIQFEALELLDAWQQSVPAGVDGNKNVLNVLGGPNVGESRLPSLPLQPEDASVLKMNLLNVCERDGLRSIALCNL